MSGGNRPTLAAQVHFKDACVYEPPSVHLIALKSHAPFVLVTVGPVEITVHAGDTAAYIAAFIEADRMIRQALAERDAPEEDQQ